jgi:hypothetical protein
VLVQHAKIRLERIDGRPGELRRLFPPAAGPAEFEQPGRLTRQPGKTRPLVRTQFTRLRIRHAEHAPRRRSAHRQRHPGHETELRQNGPSQLARGRGLVRTPLQPGRKPGRIRREFVPAQELRDAALPPGQGRAPRAANLGRQRGQIGEFRPGNRIQAGDARISLETKKAL